MVHAEWFKWNFLYQDLCNSKKKLRKIYVGPKACVGKCESNLFFAKCREARIKKVRKFEEHYIWVRGWLDRFLDFVQVKKVFKS